MPERAGTLRHRVTIEQATETPNSFNEPVKNWSTFATISADIEPLSGGEPFVAEQFAGIIDHRVQMRYLAGVVPKMRFNWNGRLFDILTVLDQDTRNKWMFVLVKEHV
jgi:SPP1 family predicted phage head-tail adaptor